MNINQTQQEEHPSDAVTTATVGRKLSPEAQHDQVELSEAKIDVEMLADLLTDHRSRLRLGPIYWAWMLASPVFGLILIAGLANREPVTICLSAIALTPIVTMRRQAELLRQARAALLNAYLGPEWLGTLVEALVWPDRRVQGSAALLLTLMLPRYAANGPEMFSPEQHTCLYRRLTRRAVAANPAFALAILEALPEIGTEAALPFVRRLSALPALSGDLRRVREAACAALATIERRIAQQRISSPAVPAATEAEPPMQSHVDEN